MTFDREAASGAVLLTSASSLGPVVRQRRKSQALRMDHAAALIWTVWA